MLRQPLPGQDRARSLPVVGLPSSNLEKPAMLKARRTSLELPAASGMGQ